MTKKKRNGPLPRVLTWRDRTLTIDQWSKETGLRRETIRYRDKVLRWPIEKILTTPPMDVTKPKTPRSVREPFPEPVPLEQRRSAYVRGILARMGEPGCMLTVEAALLAAWDDGHGEEART
jgi:hypothetical protein